MQKGPALFMIDIYLQKNNEFVQELSGRFMGKIMCYRDSILRLTTKGLVVLVIV